MRENRAAFLTSGPVLFLSAVTPLAQMKKVIPTRTPSFQALDQLTYHCRNLPKDINQKTLTGNTHILFLVRVALLFLIPCSFVPCCSWMDLV